MKRFFKKFDKKYFFKQFIIFLIAFTAVLIPVNVALGKIGGVRLFAGTESIMSEMDYIIDPDNPFYDSFKNSERVNVLLLGVNDGLTDVIMVGSYDLKNQRVDIISVPRDTYYYRAQYKSAAWMKINTIYHSEGVVKTAEAVSDVLLGMPINYYVVVDYDAVRAIVDEMGGVPIDIPFTMKYDDPYDKPPLHIYFEKGPTVLSGDDAVKYLRYRKGYKTGDIGRIGAHQEFVKSAFKQAIDHGVVDVAKVAFDEIESDITLDMIIKIAGKAVNLDSANVYTWMAPGRSGTANSASYWYVDMDETEDMIDRIYNFEDYIETEADGEVQGEDNGLNSASADL